MSKISKRKQIVLFVISILFIFLFVYLIKYSTLKKDEKFRKEVSKMQDNNVYRKDRIKLTDVTYNNNQTYLRLENIANILKSTYSEEKNKCILISNKIKLELEVDNKIAKINGRDCLLKQKIISSYGVKFISKEDVENIYDVIYDENSRTIVNKYTSKTLFVKTENKEIVEKTKPIKSINRNGLYVAKYKTIEDTQKAYNILKKDKNTIVDIESIIKVSEDEEANKEDNKKEYKNPIYDDSLKQYIQNHESFRKVKVAVIDSGVNYDLGYFDNKLLSTKINYSNSGKDAKDDFGHGTKIISTIINNSNDNIRILPIKIINNKGEGSTLSLYLALEEAIANKVDIINISLNMRYSSESDIILDTIDKATKKGIKVVVSAGNNNSNVKTYAPANSKSAIVVASCDDFKSREYYSNYGNTVDYCTYGNASQTIDINGEEYEGYGTSFSAAYITSIIASLKYTGKTINDFIEKSKDKNIGNFVGFYSYKNLKEVNDTNEYIEKNILNYFDNWKELKEKELTEICLSTDYDDLAYFYQLLSKKDKKILRNKCSYFTKDFTPYYSKINDKNEYEISETIINDNGDYIDFVDLEKGKTVKLYSFLEDYKLDKDYIIKTSETKEEDEELILPPDPPASEVQWNYNGWFYYKINDQYRGNTDMTITTKIQYYSYPADKDKVNKVTLGTSGTDNHNFKALSASTDYSVANGGYAKDIFDIKYSYYKPAHADVKGASVSGKCSQCRAEFNKHDYLNTNTGVEVKGDVPHDEVNKEAARLDLNFHNTGNRIHTKNGHIIDTIFDSKGNFVKYVFDTNKYFHVTYNINLVYGYSTLTVDLNKPGSTSITWTHTTSIKNVCNFKSGLLQYSPNCVGYDFKGWTTINGIKNYTNIISIPLYDIGCLNTNNLAIAQWEAHKLKVNFDFQGGENGKPLHLTEYKTIKFDTKPIAFIENLPVTGLDTSKGEKLPEKSGNVTFDYYYTLPSKYGTKTEIESYSEPATGYYDKKNGGTRYIEADGSGSNVRWTIDKDTTLYAQYNISIKMPKDPEKEGYIFKGWGTDPTVNPYDFTGLKEGDIYNPKGGDEKIYAIWEPIKYSVYLYPETPERARTSHVPHYSQPTFGHYDWTWTGACWVKTFTFDQTFLTEYPSDMFYLRGWTTNNPYWYALNLNTTSILGKSIITPSSTNNLTSQQGATIELYPTYTEHRYTIKFIKSRDPEILKVISGEIPDMHLLYEDYTCAPDGSELYKVDEKSDQVFRFFICDEDNVRYYQNDYDPPIYQLTDVDGAVLHFVAQWLPFRIKVDYFSITDRERGMDIIFSEGVFGQLEIEVEEEVEKIRVEFPQPDEDYTLSNYMEYVIKYDDRNLDYALDPDLNFKKIYEYNPIGMTDTTPSYPLYPKKSETKQKFFVKYSYKPLVKKKIWIHSYRDRRWINSTATYINFENRDRVPMSGKIRTRIRYDSWLED